MRWQLPDGARAAFLIGALAGCVRVLHLLDYARLPLFARPTVDAALYLEQAQRIAATGTLPEVFFKPPLYPYLLGAWLRCVGLEFFWLRLPFALLGALTAVLTWWLGRRLFDARVAFLAGCMQALQPTAVFFEGELLEVGLATCIQLGALLAVLQAGCAPRPRHRFAAGLALGLGCVAKPSFSAWALLALLWLGRRGAPLAATGLLLALAPVTLHNARHGDFVPVASNFGLNFYLGNNPWANGRMAPAPELPAEPARARRTATSLAVAAAGHELRPSQVSRYWFDRGLAEAAAAPLHTLVLLGRKLFYVCNGAAIADNEDLSGLPRYLWVYRLLPAGPWLLAPLGLLGLLLSRRTRELLLAQSFVGVQVLVLLPFFVVERFRLPWVPVLAVFAAWWLLRLHSFWGERRFWKTAATGVGVLGLCNLPLFGVREPAALDLDYKIGYAYLQEGNLDAALAAYRQAVERRPESALARNALGTLLAERGEDLDEAAALVQSAMALDASHTAHFAESLALVELRRGRPQAALDACARGLAAAPDPPLRGALLRRAGEAKIALGRAGEARTDLQQALELLPEGEPRQQVRVLLHDLEGAAETDSVPP